MRAVEELAARDESLPDLALVLDDDRRSEAFGTWTTIERIRYKPHASIVAAIRTADGGRWWCVSYSDAEKLRKSAKRAETYAAETRRLSDQTLTGAMSGDRMLAARIHATLGAAADPDAVLRYNPLRRLVVRDGDRAVKISAADAVPVAAQRLGALGVGVLVPEHIGAGAWAYEWWGAGDATDPALGSVNVLATAGAALARIHAVPVADVPLPGLDTASQASEAAEAIGTLLPALRPRALRVAAALAGLRGQWVPSHGDWSADQILTDGHDVRIIDLDRATLAPREHDLGSYLAVGGDRALLDGYLAAGGQIDPPALDAWTAFGILRRATEPFRVGDRSWPQLIEQALGRAERTLSEEEPPC